MLVVNLVSGPGAGKSTIAAGAFYKLKQQHVNCELVHEYAKELTWEGNSKKRDNQFYVSAKQYNYLYNLTGQVDVAITDTSMLLGILYNRGTVDLSQVILDYFNTFDNLIYFINRPDVYYNQGRTQTLESAKKFDDKVKQFLIDYSIGYTEVDCDKAVDLIVSDVNYEVNGVNYASRY